MNKRERRTREVNPIVTMIVGRCHVGESDRAVIRYVVSRLKQKRRTFLSMSREARRALLEDCVEQHRRNQQLYVEVMRGR